MKSYAPDKRSTLILRIAVAVVATLIIILLRIFIKIHVLLLSLSIILAAAALVIIFIYLPLYFSHLDYYATESEIKKRSGVFFRKSQSIKYSSIQYSTVITMPLSAYTGLNFIVFYVYGGRFIMVFLKKEDMHEILEKSGSLYC